jgi:hypothetical protein
MLFDPKTGVPCSLECGVMPFMREIRTITKRLSAGIVIIIVEYKCLDAPYGVSSNLIGGQIDQRLHYGPT